MKKSLLLTAFLFIMFSGFPQNRFDVVIDEIMADPSPSVGLPSSEWIELKNTSSVSMNLQNWRIGDANGQSGPLPAFILQPDSFVIISTASALASLSAYGTAIAVSSFPSLDNNGELLFLKSPNGKIIHAINYGPAWYKNELKAEGGWTLEMIDTRNPCSGFSNWKASTHVNGGTPGKKNSVDGPNVDLLAPRLLQAYTTDSVTIIMVFDEPVDSLNGASLANYSIDGGLVINSSITIAPLFNQVQLKTTTPMRLNTVYIVTATNIKDCNGNTLTTGKVKVGLPSDPVNGDWIINEILFNPRSAAFDYVEFYNRSNKIFDAASLYIATRNSSGVASSIKPLSTSPFYIFPGDYLVVTEDRSNLSQHYLVKQPEQVLELSQMPSFPDHEGTVLAINFNGTIIDEVKYKDDWHFKLIVNPEGVALERIDPAGASNNSDNWHSSASTAGYGTPTYRNSQYKLLNVSAASIEVTPKVFSPDNDGRDDVATIQYKVNEPGFVANVTVFDVVGRPVRYLVRNAIMGGNGYWNWDGLNDAGGRLPLGSYIIFTEIFNLRGRKESFKNVVVVGRVLK